MRKEHWARIISAATQYDTAITLALIEDANKKVCSPNILAFKDCVRNMKLTEQLCMVSSLRTCVALQIAEALKSEVRERAPVPVLKKQLLTLQADLTSAHERLHSTQVWTSLEQDVTL